MKRSEERHVPPEVDVEGMRLWLYDSLSEYLTPPRSEAELARRAPALATWVADLRARVPVRVYLGVGPRQRPGEVLLVLRGVEREYQIDAWLPGTLDLLGEPRARGYLGLQYLDAGDGPDGDYTRETWDDIMDDIVARGGAGCQ